jgi:hypothetical protein
MLTAAFIVIACAVGFGCILAVMHLRGVAVRRLLGALHALIGLSGLALLALALRGPARGVAQGEGSFGVIAAAFFASAAIIGGMMLARLRKGARAGALIGVHATLAISGFVMLAAYLLA